MSRKLLKNRAEKSESSIQNEIRLELAANGVMEFRANVGRAWTGSQVERINDGRDIIIRNARPFSTGLPAGFSDLFAAVPQLITQDMVSDTLAVFTAIEVKSSTGRASQRQLDFLDAVRRQGGRAGIARTPAEALEICWTHRTENDK